jgi:hypothetical protein
MEKSYFEQKSEKEYVPEENAREFLRRLSEPITSKVPDLSFKSAPAGVFHDTMANGANIRFEWTPAEEKESIRSYEFNAKQSEKYWATLTAFTLRSGSEEFRLDDLAPEGWSVIFRRRPIEQMGGDTRIKEKLLMIGSNILSRKGIMELFHEAGHAHILETMTEDQQNQYLKTVIELMAQFRRHERPMSSDAVDSVLNTERNAWAFALKHIRPLVDADVISKEDLRYFIHHVALKWYSDQMGGLIDEGLVI